MAPSPAQQVAGLRFGVGVLAYASPTVAARLFGMDPSNGEAAFMGRLFGARDIALGAGTLSTTGDEHRRWVTLGLACDVLDLGATVLGKRDGSLGTVTTVLVGAAATSAIVNGALALKG